MPFTPFHMGPGIFIKSLFQGGFSLMVFGWTQIIMDIQPLFVLLSGQGHLHGFSHTYIGASLIAVFSAVTGKHLSEYFLTRYKVAKQGFRITWLVAVISAAIGAISHVVIDSIMHSDVEPYYPFYSVNPLLGMVSIPMLHNICLLSGALGAVVFYAVLWSRKK